MLQVDQKLEEQKIQMYGYISKSIKPKSTSDPFAGAQDGDEFAFLPFGGNNKQNDPTKNKVAEIQSIL